MLISSRPFDLSQSNFSQSVDLLLQRIYQSRGVTSDNELNLGLSQLPLPDALMGIENAVEYLVMCLHQQQRILIVGD